MLWPINAPGPARARCSRRLELLAHLVFVLFMLLCFVPIWPIRALDPPWLLRLGNQVLQSAGLVLIGIVMLEFARHLAPWRRHLRARRALILSSVNLASVGFLLMIPLQIFLVGMTRVIMSNPQNLELMSSFALESSLQRSTFVRASLALGYALAFNLAGRQLRQF